jgi:acetyltransferase
LRKLGERAGDHETKVLLAAYGITVTRQAVATTPSGATRIAKQAGFPVQVKPWGPDQPSELDGCPVIGDLGSAAEVRRAFAAISTRAGLEVGSPVIVRETPAGGRELDLRLQSVIELGPMILAHSGTSAVAAPTPLRRADATRIADLAAATRAGDESSGRTNLIEALIRISHLFSENADVLRSIRIARLVVSSSDGTVVAADACSELTAG